MTKIMSEEKEENREKRKRIDNNIEHLGNEDYKEREIISLPRRES